MSKRQMTSIQIIEAVFQIVYHTGLLRQAPDKARVRYQPGFFVQCLCLRRSQPS